MATVFSVIDAVLLRPPEFADPVSVVHVQTADEKGESDNLLPSVFEQVRSRSDLFIQAAGSRGALFTVTRVPAQIRSSVRASQEICSSYSAQNFGSAGC